jgi:pimeloyl-ACP methyl ester carboxylesterase
VNAPVGHTVTIGERKLWMHRSGDGEPAIVFVPGGGSVGLDFLLVHEQVAQLTTSVLYDRAGTGWSDDADLPRSADEVTDELRALLRAAGLPRPTCSWATRSAASMFSDLPSVSQVRSSGCCC